MIHRAVLLTLSLLAAGVAAAQSQQQAIRDQIFGETDAVKAGADAVQAEILAPEAYGDAIELYARAGDGLVDGRNLDLVREQLTEARGHFQRATEAAELFRVSFPDTLAAREAAVAAEAATYAERGWRRAEETLNEAAEQLEGGNLNAATRTAADAIEEYREAEAEAINEGAKVRAGATN